MVLVARRALGVLDTLDHAVAFESAQAACQDVAGRAGISSDLIEPVNAQGHLTKRQQRPPLPQDPEARRNETRSGAICCLVGWILQSFLCFQYLSSSI